MTGADAAWRRLLDGATEPYRQAGNFAWHFARGKLGRDPVFRGSIERGLIGATRSRVVDIGCGQGLFASLLATMAHMQVASGEWPVSWAPTPAAFDYTGIELMPKDVARAERALGALRPASRFVCDDMRSAALPACDLVVILDVLHYVDHAAQQRVLERVHDALAPGGRLLLRVGDADDRRGFAISQWVDRTVTRIRGHRVSPTWGRTVQEWSALLHRLGFEARSIPMSEGTPFANVLLVADRKVAAAAAAPEPIAASPKPEAPTEPMTTEAMTTANPAPAPATTHAPQTLDRAGIASRIPHAGSMCLLERLDGWDAQEIRCATATHRLADNPLRTATGLLAPNLVEYAAQAMALHGGLLAPAGSEPSAGFLASVRNVRLSVGRVDDVEGELAVRARRLSGDTHQILYEFTVDDATARTLAEGRAVVVLNTPIPPQESTP